MVREIDELETEAGAAATLEAFNLGAVDFVAKPGGAISLGIHELSPVLVAKVRGAAGAKPRRSATATKACMASMRSMPLFHILQ